MATEHRPGTVYNEGIIRGSVFYQSTPKHRSRSEKVLGRIHLDKLIRFNLSRSNKHPFSRLSLTRCITRYFEKQTFSIDLGQFKDLERHDTVYALATIMSPYSEFFGMKQTYIDPQAGKILVEVQSRYLGGMSW